MPPSVLIVDDNDYWVNTLAATFSAAGCQPWAARTIDDALLTASISAPSLVITELTVAGKYTFEMVSAIAATHRSAQIVLLTCCADVRHAWQALRAGAHICLAKPALAADILANIAPEDGRLQEALHRLEHRRRLSLDDISSLYIDFVWNRAPSLSCAARILGTDRRWLQRWLRRQRPPTAGRHLRDE